MNKKFLIIILTIILLVVLGAVIYFVFVPKSTKDITLDLATINQEITNQGPFHKMATMELDKETISSVVGIENDKIEEVVGKMPLMNVQASMFFVIKVVNGQLDAVKQQVETYLQDYENLWSRYLPQQYELVKNRKVGVNGNYIYVIISEGAEELEKLIR